MAWVVDDLAAWLVGLLADAGCRKLTEFVLGTEQERALRKVAKVAIRRTAAELLPGADDSVGMLTMVLDEVFVDPVPSSEFRGSVTLLETIRSGVEYQLAPLGDVELTGVGESSAEVLATSAVVLAEVMSRNLLQEIIDGGSGGGPLAPLANQLDHDRTFLQGQRIEGLVSKVLRGLDELRAGPQEAAREAAGMLIMLDNSCRKGGACAEILDHLLDRATREMGCSNSELRKLRERLRDRGLDPRVLIQGIPQHQEAVRRWTEPLGAPGTVFRDGSKDSMALLASFRRALGDELSAGFIEDSSASCRSFLVGALNGNSSISGSVFIRWLSEYLPPLRSTSREAVLVRSAADGSTLYKGIDNAGTRYGLKLGSIARRMCSLPPPDLYITGREVLVDRVAAAVSGVMTRREAAIAFLAGQPGVGTSAVAIETARALKPTFSGGIVYIDLRGLIPDSRRDARTAVRIVSEALGFDLTAASEGDDQLFAAFSAQLADKNILLVLDNARDASHVSSMAHAPAGCGVIVTSRDRIQDYADPSLVFEVPPLARDAAMQLLGKFAEDRPHDEKLFNRLANLCADVPLALRIVGARIASRPDLDFAYLAHLLSDEATRLDYLEAGDRAVRAAIRLSYDDLNEPARHVLRMMTAVPGSVVTSAELGHCLEEANLRQELLLNRLADRSLARQAVLLAPTGNMLANFSLHDLVDLFGAERREAEEPSDEVREFRRRFIAHLSSQLSAITDHAEDAELTGELDPMRFHAAERMAEAEKWPDLASELAFNLYVLYRLRKERDNVIVISEIRIRLHLRGGQPDRACQVCLDEADDLRAMKAIEQALVTARHAQMIAQDNGLTSRVAEAYFKISFLLGELEEWEAALEAGNLAVTEIANSGHESAAVGAAINNCTFGRLAGDKAAAVEWGRRALEIADRWGDQPQKAFAADEYGIAQRFAGKYSDSIELHLRARALWEAEGHWWNSAMACLFAARSADRACDAVTAARMFGSAIDYWERGAHLPQLLETLIDLSALHVRTLSFKEAEVVLERARKAADNSSNPPPLMREEIRVRKEVLRVLIDPVPRAHHRSGRNGPSLPRTQTNGPEDPMNENVLGDLQRYLSGDTNFRVALERCIGIPTWNEPDREPRWFHSEFQVSGLQLPSG